MVVDIPTEFEFVEAGLDYLNMAWDSAVSLMLHIEYELIDQEPHEYLKVCQRKLQSALALSHQGIEMILKGKIVGVSPFLLISSKPDGWPKNCAQQDIPFSHFRTIDAQDLIKVVNTVHAERLPCEFVTLFNALRIKRNKVMHSVAKQSLLTPLYVLELILDVVKLLLPSYEWLHFRKCYKDNQSASYFDELIYGNGEIEAYALGDLQREIYHVVELLTPSKAKKHFNFDKKKNRYICTHCVSIRENEHFFELKNREWSYLESAYWISRPLNKAFCLYCKENALIDLDD